MSFRHLITSVSAAALLALTAEAQFTLPDGVPVEENVQITMRDGARLNADIYLPDTDGPVPTIYVRTPYDGEMDSRSDLHEQLLQRGYARNLNTDQDPYTSIDFAVVTNSIHLDEGHASFVSLPVYTAD